MKVLKKDYFVNRLKNFEKYYLGWCDEYSLIADDNVKGPGGWIGRACGFFQGTIGDNSCYGYRSCYQVRRGEFEGRDASS